MWIWLKNRNGKLQGCVIPGMLVSCALFLLVVLVSRPQTVWAAAFGLLKLFSSFEQTEIGAFLFSGGEVNWLDYKISFFKLWWVGIHSSYSKVRVYDISLSEFLAPEASKLWFNNSSSVHQCTESPCQKKKIRTRTFLKQQFFIIDSSWELVGAVH